MGLMTTVKSYPAPHELRHQVERCEKQPEKLAQRLWDLELEL
jgi:hypothetical protein